MQTFNSILDRDVPCHSTSENFNEGNKPPDCEKVIKAGLPHYRWVGGAQERGYEIYFCRSCVRHSNWRTHYNVLKHILVEVDLLYHDGSKCVLTGDDADTWGDLINSALIVSAVNERTSESDVKWTVLPPPDPKRATEREFLLWFYKDADFGPASGAVRDIMKEMFKKKTGKELPEGYAQSEDCE